MTASVAAVTVTGAWYGAGLKFRQEYKQVLQPRTCVRVSPTDDDCCVGAEDGASGDSGGED